LGYVFTSLVTRRTNSPHACMIEFGVSSLPFFNALVCIYGWGPVNLIFAIIYRVAEVLVFSLAQDTHPVTACSRPLPFILSFTSWFLNSDSLSL